MLQPNQLIDIVLSGELKDVFEELTRSGMTKQEFVKKALDIYKK